MACQWCGSKDTSLQFIANGFDSEEEEFSLLKCCGCRLVRTSPELSDEELSRYYGSDYYGSPEAKFQFFFEQMVAAINLLRAKWLRKKIMTGNQCRLLDIGPGRGGFLRAMSCLGVDCYGVERSEFPVAEDLPYTLLKGELVDLSLEVESFDAVTLWHVLEHMNRPREMFRQIAKVLKPGGMLLIAVPNFNSWQSRLFRHNWFHLDLPRHILHYSPEWIEEHCREIGYVEEIYTLPTIEQSIFGFLQSIQNWIVPGASNRLYSLLQRKKNAIDYLLLLGLGVVAMILLPVASIEHVMSGFFNRNASVVMVIRKP